MTDSITDPREAGPKPSFDQPPQEPPGTERDMDPKADHGEQSYHGFGRLTGRAAIITGADSGIGRAVAIAFAREGADVLISYLSEDDDAQETRRLVEDAGRRAVVVAGGGGGRGGRPPPLSPAPRPVGGPPTLLRHPAL